MLKPSKSLTLSLAIELGFLDEQQLQTILTETGDSKSSEMEIAVRKGLLVAKSFGFSNRLRILKELLPVIGSPD